MLSRKWYRRGFGLSFLGKKVKESIALIQKYSDEALFFDERGYAVGFSGGKDSIVIAKLVEMANVPFELSYSQTTIDPPELLAFIKEVYPQTKWLHPKKGFFARLPERLLPTRNRRWCCQEYKENSRSHKVTLLGIRQAESPRRKSSWNVEWAPFGNGFGLLPILRWSDEDVWEFIDNEGLRYCLLYDEGFNRLGCVGCPMASTKQRIVEFRRWPGFGRAWRASIFRWYERHKGKLTKKGKPYFLCERYDSPEDLWFWWLFEGKFVGPETRKCVDELLRKRC